MINFRSNSLNDTPPVIKNLLIINVLMFILTNLMNEDNMVSLFGLHYFQSDYFRWWQVITHMFMHGGITHIFFNMFALWMFGKVLEQVWGSKRFLFYYMVTGIGAALIHTFVNYLSFSHIQYAITAFGNTPSPELYASILRKYFNSNLNPSTLTANMEFISAWAENASNPAYIAAATNNLHSYMTALINIPTVGASGAVFGVLLGFGMLFPNTELMLLFPPIPLKAKWVVIGYGSIELYMGLTQPGSNIAHFAHLGGMLFGFILIKYWNTKRTNFY